MTDADIDRAIIEINRTHYGCEVNVFATERAIYLAGFAAGLEAAAKVCDDYAKKRGEDSDEGPLSPLGSLGRRLAERDGRNCAAEIRAMNKEK